MVRIMIKQKGNQIVINIKGKWMAKKDSKFKNTLEIRNYKRGKISQDEIARIRKRKRGRNMLNRSGNTTDLSLLLSLLSRLQLLVLLSLSPFLDKWSPINDI